MHMVASWTDRMDVGVSFSLHGRNGSFVGHGSHLGALKCFQEGMVKKVKIWSGC